MMLFLCNFYQAAFANNIHILLVSVALICLVLYSRKIVLSKICKLYCLVSLNSVLFLTLFVSIYSFDLSCPILEKDRFLEIL